MSVIYDSAHIYIASSTQLCDKIVKIDAILVALEDIALAGASTGNYDEYSLDDGQTKIKTKYRGIEDIAKAIKAFETIRQRYINRLNGRHVRLIDGKNFI